MNRLFNFGALAAFALAASVPALAQTPEEHAATTIIIHNVRVLSPEVSRSLKIVRAPLPTSRLLIGFYWLCGYSENEGCRNTVVVCTDDQSQCVQVD